MKSKILTILTLIFVFICAVGMVADKSVKRLEEGMSIESLDDLCACNSSSVYSFKIIWMPKEDVITLKIEGNKLDNKVPFASLKEGDRFIIEEIKFKGEGDSSREDKVKVLDLETMMFEVKKR